MRRAQEFNNEIALHFGLFFYITTSFVLACCCFWIEIQVKIIKKTIDQRRERNDDSKLSSNKKSERIDKKIEPVNEPNKEGTPEKTQVKA